MTDRPSPTPAHGWSGKFLTHPSELLVMRHDSDVWEALAEVADARAAESANEHAPPPTPHISKP